MGKEFESEEERQERYRKEVLDELNDKKLYSNIGKNVTSYSMKKKNTSVNFDKNKKTQEQVEEEKNINELDKKETGGKSNIALYVVCLLIIVGGVFVFPFINDFITEIKLKSKDEEVVVKKKETEKVYEKLTLDSSAVRNLVYPKLHFDKSKMDNYYKLDKITTNKLTNADILYNAFLDVYEGAILPYKGNYSSNYCGDATSKVYFDANYINSRIENIFNKKTSFKHTDFYVPKYSGSKYVGWWKYDSKDKIYVYYGDCNLKESKFQYLDVSIPYKVETSDKNIDLYVYSYIAFIKVDNDTNNYTIYRNADYTDEILSGQFKSNNYNDELKAIIDDKLNGKFNKYKYSFAVTDCAFQDYCFVSGEWVK